MAVDKVEKKIREVFAATSSREKPKRRQTKGQRDADHKTRLTEKRISRLVRGAERRNARKAGR